MKKLFKTNVLFTIAIVLLFSLTSSVPKDSIVPSFQHFYQDDTVVPEAYIIITSWEPLVFLTTVCPSGLVFSCNTNQCVFPSDKNYCHCHE
jgi:hypothetical protein